MRKIYSLLLLVVISTGISNAQTSRYKLFLELGAKYTPIEYLGGPIIGLSLDDSIKKFGFDFRQDYLISVGKNFYSPNNFTIVEYHTYNYFDFDYKVFKNLMRVGLGGGWIYSSDKENYRLNSETGYPCASIFIKNKISWLLLELRGDIPLGKSEKIFNRGYLFPLSFALIYKIKPKDYFLKDKNN